MQVLLELLDQCFPQPSHMSLGTKSHGDLPHAFSSHLVAQQQPLDGSVDGLGVGLSTHFKDVLVRRQQILTHLFQQCAALRREHVGEVWHLVAANLHPRQTRSEERQPPGYVFLGALPSVSHCASQKQVHQQTWLSTCQSFPKIPAEKQQGSTPLQTNPLGTAA